MRFMSCFAKNTTALKIELSTACDQTCDFRFACLRQEICFDSFKKDLMDKFSFFQSSHRQTSNNNALIFIDKPQFQFCIKQGNKNSKSK